MHGTVTTPDGTTLGYHQLGSGPGVLVLHGAMESAVSHRELAEALSSDFTVFLLDRRGRGHSGAFPADYSVRHEVSDVAAMLAATGTSRIFGVSSGAIIALDAALTIPSITHAAIFEPPIFPEPTVPATAMADFDREIAAGDLPAAMVIAMRAAQMGPALLARMPRGLLTKLTAFGMRQDDKNISDGYVPMRALGPLLHYDLTLSAQASGPVDRYAAITAEVLLCSGTKSPAYLRRAVATLATVLPKAHRVEFPGLDHGASGNANRRGKPAVVAAALRDFFA